MALPSEASGVKVLEEALTIVAVDDQDGDDIEVHDTSGVIFPLRTSAVWKRSLSKGLARPWRSVYVMCDLSTSEPP